MAKDKITFKFEGLTELQQALRELPKEVGKNILWNAAMRGSEVVRKEVENQIQAKGLVKSGKLLKSPIKRREKTDDPMIASFRIGQDEATFWDYFHELGTVKMKATPFMLPALEASRSDAMNEIVDTLSRRIKTAAKRIAKLRKRSFF